jgi:hypothetical protein
MDRMDYKPARFRFTLGRLLYATLLAAACVAMFTLPLTPAGDPWTLLRVNAGFAFGGAAIGTLLERAFLGALCGIVAIPVLVMMGY